MPPAIASPKRFLGLDIHKFYLIATGVDAELKLVYGPRRIELTALERWLNSDLTPEDEVVIEMATNTWQIYDDLLPKVRSITVVQPPVACVSSALRMFKLNVTLSN